MGCAVEPIRFELPTSKSKVSRCVRVCVRPCRQACMGDDDNPLLGCERIEGSDIRLEHFPWHFAPDHVVERLARTVRWHKVVRIDFF